MANRQIKQILTELENVPVKVGRHAKLIDLLNNLIDAVRSLANGDNIVAGVHITKNTDEGNVKLSGTPGGKSVVAGETSQLQIVRTPPFNYSGSAPTKDDFFVSFGLYNGVVPAGIDDKITISGETHVYLEVTVSSVNPAYASAVTISSAATAPVNAEPVAGEWPTTVYVPLGKIEDVDGSWQITNYGNGSVGGAVFMSYFEVNADGTVDVSYAFSASRF